MGITRRDVLRLSGMGLGACMAAGTVGSAAIASGSKPKHEHYPPSHPGEELDPDEMRLTFCGTWFTPRPIQAANSIFVELGNGDSFVFDCGSGVVARYVALGVAYSRMDKIFLTHLHGDHTSDLFFIYCFGPSADRKTPLYVWGPTGDTPEEGTKYFCDRMYEMANWHRESFSFLPTGYAGDGDGYELVVKECEYMDDPGLAYEKNGVTIRHFPAVHDRNGSISYRLDWNGLSMVFTGDTKPNEYVLKHARGVDVLIHEMTPSPEVWAAKMTGLKEGDPGWEQAVAYQKAVQDSSHTTQPAFGYVLSQTRPRLGVGTHCPVDDDLIAPAYEDIRCFYDGPVTIARDLMVLDVSKKRIRQRMAVVPEFPWYTAEPFKAPLADPKYPTPTYQLSNALLTNVIPEERYATCGDEETKKKKSHGKQKG